ncbi:MAG: type IV secretion system DNA-binding domain-containing protein [Candidatus Magasanikbacteria bacterium]|nr:type IV secretion system DNA-binding domain-containing protein [Candidatus Magasanikbacteria bacterium]MBT4071145.1 type IV secretion system DNA-binding domain-containing protein [Candidatus Magasanikbacteria bacterium]
MKTGEKKADESKICLFAQTNFRNQMRRFGIKVEDRRRHMYVIGKTGMGKTTMMENMILHDIYGGTGIGLIDPHGDFAEKIIDFIPPSRMNDVVYINPSDLANPIGFNILEVKNEEQKHLVAAGLMGTFKKIWPDVWSSRMEYILNNTLLALLEYPDSTLLGINRLLSDKKFRNKVVAKVKDPVIKGFWQNEFAGYNDRYAQEAVAPIQNKIGQFLSASVIRNMVAQVKSTFDIREIMDEGKILIMNLSKGRIGEDNSRLLGGMLITKIQLAAMERVDTPEEDRTDFFLYVDEFQNFATPSFANILSEARKYHLGLVMAHQYVAQLDEVVADAVFGNVGTIVTFRVGAADAELLAKEFAPVFLEEDIVNLGKYNILLKLMIDGVASQPFSSTTLPPIGSSTGSTEKVVRISRERYAKNRDKIEDKIMRWSGLEPAVDEGAAHIAKLPTPKKSGSERKNKEDKKIEKQQEQKSPKKKFVVDPDVQKRYDLRILEEEKQKALPKTKSTKDNVVLDKKEKKDSQKETISLEQLPNRAAMAKQPEKKEKVLGRNNKEDIEHTLKLSSLEDKKKRNRKKPEKKSQEQTERQSKPTQIQPNTVIHFDS